MANSGEVKSATFRSFEKDYPSEPLEHYVPPLNSFFASRDFASSLQS